MSRSWEDFAPMANGVHPIAQSLFEKLDWVG